MRRIVIVAAILFSLAVGVAGLELKDPFLAGVNRSVVNASQQSDVERMEELRRVIQEEIGEPAAKNLPQCKVIAFGAKPCGGPVTYLVYSTANTNESRLKSLVSEYNQRQKRHNEERQMVSDCMVVTEPKVELIDGVCKIKRGRPPPQ